MTKHTVTTEDITSKLLQPGPKLNMNPVQRLPAPATAMSISLTLDQLRPYDRNPRTQVNPKYDEIKESIRAVGLRQKLSVTQRPGDDRYMISDGGNTRLTILKELYEETGEDKFYRQDCHFTPWQGEIHVLAGHLAENDNRGQLSWIERARGIYEAKRMIEEEAGEEVSQRELTRRLQALGYTISHSHISKMLYTIEHFLPTIPMTLEAGMGRPQVERLTAYRQYCEEFWNRCRDYWQAHREDPGAGQQWADNVLDGDFAQAWHDEMVQLDHEGQTEFAWNLVEDRLKGMLHEQTGIHFNPIDMSCQNWFAVRKYGRSVTEEERADVWTTVDAELERLRVPQERQLYPPLKGEGDTKASRAPRSRRDDGEAISSSQAPQAPEPLGEESRDAPDRTRQEESPEILEMRARIEELEQYNAELEAKSTQVSTPAPLPFQGQGEDDDFLDDGGFIQDIDPSPAEVGDDPTNLIDDLTLDPYHESEGHRQLRHVMAQEHGEEAIDFDAAALKSVPLQSGGPVAPITDLWSIPGWRRNARDLRMQIGEMVKALAEWAGLEASGTSDVIRLTAREGLGYEVGPLEGSPSRRAQLIWQFLAGLQGDIDPMLPADISLFGELIGSHGSDDEVRLPDGLLIRVWRLTRLIRVLRETLGQEGDPQS